jgi:hypothetical protein
MMRKPVSPSAWVLGIVCGLSAAAVVTAEILPAVHEEYNASLRAQMPLEEGWANPPRLARTRAYWWWLNGDNDKETITRDLEAMKANGMGGALVFDAGGDDQRGNRRVPHGPDFGSREWRALFTHAMAEADRLGLEMGLNIQSGWNLGGPTVTVEESSKRATFSKTPASGGTELDLQLPQPPTHAGFYRDVAVLAVPLGKEDTSDLKIAASSSQKDHGPQLAFDGRPNSFWVSESGPSEADPQWLEAGFAKTVKADRIVITPRPGYGPKRGRIEALVDGRQRELATFTMKADAEETVAFDATETTAFRIVIIDAWDSKPGPARNAQIARVALFSGEDALIKVPQAPGGIAHLDQKAYFSYPGGFTGTEAWHLVQDSAPGAGVCAPEEVVDLTKMMDASGRLKWQAPAGKWEILRFGYTSTGAHVSTHSQNAGGLAIDYLDRATLDSYWSRVLDPILEDVKPYLGKSLRFLHTDSWELGPVNWTREMPAEFKRLRGYDPTPWLPVLAGYPIGDSRTTTRFLNDFRRTLADLMAENKYEAFAKKSHALGLGTHPECGGPHAGPMDSLRNLGISDVPMGEFWSRSPQHRVHDYQRFFVKQTTSAANTYGRRVSLAEAFTNIGRHWQHDPRSLKPTFDRAACEGHNLTMWHTFAASPKERGMPGSAYFAGEHFNPNITWWTQGKAFIEYMNRCHFMLQQGVAANDVLHFYGENIPAFVRLKRDDPAKCLPGYDYDVIDMRALLERTDVDAAGHVVLPEGTSYRVLSLVPHDAISLPALEHVAKLVEKGATLVGPPPQHPFSLSGGKTGDERFAALRVKLWGEGDEGTRKVGKGRVIRGMTTREVLQADGVPEAFSWKGGDNDTFIDFIQRRTDDTRIYFVANRNDRPEDVELRFGVTGFIPEFWDPVTGSRRDATAFREEEGRTVIPYPMHGEQSFFVLFRKPLTEDAVQDVPNVAQTAKRLDVEGAWEVSFDPAWGGPEKITFETLSDWTKHADEGIRHYSGSAVYDKTFNAPAIDGPVFLDLGGVESLCEVKLNGEDLGVLWSAPFRIEVTGKLKTGTNRLQVKVVNLWANRIIGDTKLPAAERRTRTNITNLTKDTPLEPSGLFGPVRLEW